MSSEVFQRPAAVSPEAKPSRRAESIDRGYVSVETALGSLGAAIARK